MKLLNANSWKMLLVWIIVLTILYSTLSILRHNHFQSGGFDLGLYDQSVWQYSQLLSPYNTIKERFILGDHLALTLPLISPLFKLWDDVRILLIFQAFWVSFSTFAVYKIARLRKLSPLISFNISFVYSLFYGIQFLIFFDFHPVALGVGLLIWLAYFLEAKKKKLFWITLVLLLLTQENMGIALASLGFVYLFVKKHRKTALLFIVGGIFVSFAAVKIVALFSPVGYQYSPQIIFEPIHLAKEFFNSEEKQQVWLYSLSWFSFLPLFSPGAILGVFLDLAQYFITGPEFMRMWSPFMHHRAILGPILALGTLNGMLFLQRRRVNIVLLSFVLVVASLGLQYYLHFPLNKLTKPIYWQEEAWMEDNRRLIKEVPKEASVVSAQNLVPHLSHRKEIYLAWPRKIDLINIVSENPCGEKTCWWFEFGGKPEYLVLDLHPNQWITQLLESNENFESAVKNMEKAGKIELEKEINSAKLYRIKY